MTNKILDTAGWAIAGFLAAWLGGFLAGSGSRLIRVVMDELVHQPGDLAIVAWFGLAAMLTFLSLFVFPVLWAQIAYVLVVIATITTRRAPRIPEAVLAAAPPFAVASATIPFDPSVFSDPPGFASPGAALLAGLASAAVLVVSRRVAPDRRRLRLSATWRARARASSGELRWWLGFLALVSFLVAGLFARGLAFGPHFWIALVVFASTGLWFVAHTLRAESGPR